MDPDVETEFDRAAAASRERMRIEQPHLYAKLSGSRGEAETEPSWQPFDRDTPVILVIDLPTYALHAGDLGTVIKRHADGAVYTVEFLSLAGKAIAVVELEARHLRRALTDEIAQVRSLDQKKENDAH